MNDTTSILGRWFPSRAKDRAMRQGVQTLIDQITTQNQTLKEIGERVSRLESHAAAIQALNDDVRAIRALLDAQSAQMRTLEELGDRIGARIDANNASLADAVRAPLTQQLAEAQLQIAERMDANNAGLRDAIHGSLIQRIAEAQLWLEKISAENQSALAHLDGSIIGARGDIGGLANQIAEVRLWLEKISAETTNGLAHLDGSAVEVRLALEKISTETNNRLTHIHGSTVTEFNRLFNEALPQVNMQSHVAAALLLDARARGVDRSRWHASELERYRSAKEENFDRTLAKVAADFPNVARSWRERLDEIANAFAITKTGNAANAADLYSRMFKSFVEYHIHGRVLDVGCGVFGRPFYLSEYPAKLISGIEPLEMIEGLDFECVRGVSEYLPWSDGSFSTVINATSLDHVASLEKSLAEMSRVLRPGGTLLLWIGSMKGSPEFEPDSPQFVPADQFHLFHFDTAWFEPMLAAQWEIVDRMEFATSSFDHVFYALRSAKCS